MKSLTLLAAAIFCAATICSPARAQEEAADPQPVIEANDNAPSDAAIAERIEGIFDEIDTLQNVEANVSAGVVTLTGVTKTADAAARAEAIAARVSGVVTVENEIDRDVSVDTRVAPAVHELETYVQDAVKFAPLFALALAVFFIIVFLGVVLSRWSALWRRVTPNLFIAELVQTTIRVIFFIAGAILALRLLDATALLSAILGAAGVLGLAVGFAVRDTIENYIASIMLSLRQPFRPNDHVVIEGNEGRVIRLTSRATILMTLDGNHLRIPNAAVFKAVILNYSRNPERRFTFELGVDADDDPVAAMETGLNAIKAMDFVLADPAPIAFIKNVGDSNIIITFAAWIDQRNADFAKSRSVALSAAKDALEDEGFALPEPIYRLRFDAASPPILKEATSGELSAGRPPEQPAERRKARTAKSSETVDVSPDTDIADKVEEERRESGEDDLLEEDAPIE